MVEDYFGVEASLERLCSDKFAVDLAIFNSMKGKKEQIKKNVFFRIVLANKNLATLDLILAASRRLALTPVEDAYANKADAGLCAMLFLIRENYKSHLPTFRMLTGSVKNCNYFPRFLAEIKAEENFESK